MSKTVLVLDEMPDCCCDCPLCVHDKHIGNCCVPRNKAPIKKFAYKITPPEWCPLHKLPQPAITMDIFFSHRADDCADANEGYVKGWNDCSDKFWEVIHGDSTTGD